MRWLRSERAATSAAVSVERRRTSRYYVRLPVKSAHGTGTTIDVSEEGVRFESPSRFVCGEEVTLRLVFRHIAGDYTYIDVTGMVQRVEESGETFVVAVCLDESHLDGTVCRSPLQLLCVRCIPPRQALENSRY